MQIFDTTFLDAEGLPPPVSFRRRALRVLLWSGAVSGGGAVLVVVFLHLAPVAGAAGGCGGG